MTFFIRWVLVGVLKMRLTVFIVHTGENDGNDHQNKTEQTKEGEFLVQKAKSEEVGKHHAAQHEKQGVG